MERLDERLRELQHEQIETRNQSIKTDNALTTLAGEIRTITRRQDAYERRLYINSAAAYALFALLSFAGLFAFFRASAQRAAVDHELVDAEKAQLLSNIDDLEDELARRREAEREAYDFYELLASGRRGEVVERFPSVQGRLVDRATIELFRREVESMRVDLARESYEVGTQHFEDERYQETRDALTRSLGYVEVAPYSPDLYFRLGEALYELDDHAGALRYLSLAAEYGELPRQQALRAAFHRAESLRRLERFPEALEAYQLFIRRFDGHYWVGTARARAEAIEDRLAEP